MYLTFTQTLNVNPRLLSKNVISVFFVSLAGLMFFSPIAASGELYPEIKPDPVYTPDEVVGIQMRALGKNNQPYDNAGIELTFRFASPGNKKILDHWHVLKPCSTIQDTEPCSNIKISTLVKAS